MPNVIIQLGGREYKVACDVGEEDHVRVLAQDIDDRVQQLVFRMGPRGEAILLVMVALMMADELGEVKKEIGRLREEITHTSQSFERTKLIEMGEAVSLSVEDIAARIEKIAEQLEG